MWVFVDVIGADVRRATYIVRLDELVDTIWCKSKEVCDPDRKDGSIREIADRC